MNTVQHDNYGHGRFNIDGLFRLGESTCGWSFYGYALTLSLVIYINFGVGSTRKYNSRTVHSSCKYFGVILLLCYAYVVQNTHEPYFRVE